MTDVRIVLVTAPVDEAPSLARALVRESLAACVNVIGGVRSFYEWRGEFCEEPESLLVIKTTCGRVARLTDRVVALHSYETPELLVLPVEAGESRYLQWVMSQCAPQEEAG